MRYLKGKTKKENTACPRKASSFNKSILNQKL